MLSHTRPRSANSKFRLLYLGNDLEVIAALRRSLTEPDYLLISCSDRESAILFLRSEIPYDLVVIDFEWLKTEGLELARLARSLRHRERMPIILVAATGLSSELKSLAGEAGVNECITKTATMTATTGAIRRIIEGGTTPAD